jgi:hypothetical protein
MRRFRAIIGVGVIALSVAAILAIAVQFGVTRQGAALAAFFAAAIYVGMQLVRVDLRTERAHQEKLRKLLAEVKSGEADASRGSDRPGGADARDQRG